MLPEALRGCADLLQHWPTAAISINFDRRRNKHCCSMMLLLLLDA
jgi:hypothetical protein